MRVALRRKYCSPDQIKIEQTEQPIVKENEVLVKVFATTVNRTDCANLTGRPFIMRFVLGLIKPRKIVLGTDFAGEVIDTGEKVKAFKLGDKVFGFTDTGIQSQAEYCVVQEKNVYPIPEQVDYIQAAASLEGAHYAYTFIHKVKIQSGQSILINGATGAIGSALLQFVNQYDVKLTATCDTKNIDLIKTLGANKIYDYKKEDFTEDIDKYDFVFDAVGKSTYGKCKALLKEKGVYISSELGPNSQHIFFALFSFLFQKKVVFPIPHATQKTIPYISTLLQQGNFKPVIDKEFELDDIADAYKYVISGKKTGNVIINIR